MRPRRCVNQRRPAAAPQTDVRRTLFSLSLLSTSADPKSSSISYSYHVRPCLHGCSAQIDACA